MKLYPKGDNMTQPLIAFIKERRKAFDLSQVELADRAGVGIRFIRELEQGKNFAT